MSKTKSLIIIPVCNEQENIIRTIQDIEQNIPEASYIVINDCSSDNTREILRSYRASYPDVPVNLGIGGGVQTGYRYAVEHGYDIAVQFDGDGQHDARYISGLIAPIESGQADVVIGSRFITYEPTNALFAFMFFCVIIILMSITAIVSKLNEKNKRLIQSVALLEKRVRELERAEEE